MRQTLSEIAMRIVSVSRAGVPVVTYPERTRWLTLFDCTDGTRSHSRR
jgi:hypothetical protein